MTYATIQPSLASLYTELAAMDARLNELRVKPQTEAEFDAMCSEYEGMSEVHGELMFAIQALEAELETQISKAEAIGMLEETAVYARLKDGSEIRVGAIAWTTWISFDDHSTHSVDDVACFFIN